PAGCPDPRSLPLIDWTENCSTETQQWFRTQDWLPPATINVAEDTVLLSMVAHGLGMAIVPETTAADRAPTVVFEPLGSTAPRRTIGYVTTPALSRSTALRELVAELRNSRSPR
ncbi:MAG: hypothetical protein QOH84_3816, partial [Kribbellaceae bacterium]|nr:hypothetical protein [Kribbellaceae bacterium]